MREVKDLRLFFALWPDNDVRNQIDAFMHGFRKQAGRVVPRYNWHMTLHFIGNTSFVEKECLDRKAKLVSGKPFELCIDQTGYFKKPKVFWLGLERAPEALFNLQKNLGNEISQCQYQPEERAYSPHITVARKVQKLPDLNPPAGITWHIDRFVLIESVSEANGVRYRVMEEYLLR